MPTNNVEFLRNANHIIADLTNRARLGSLDRESQLRFDALITIVKLSPTLNTNPEVIRGLAEIKTLLGE